MRYDTSECCNCVISPHSLSQPFEQQQPKEKKRRSGKARRASASSNAVADTTSDVTAETDETKGGDTGERPLAEQQQSEQVRAGLYVSRASCASRYMYLLFCMLL